MKGKRQKKKIDNRLLQAMRFVGLSQRSVGSPEQTHCRMFNQWVSASNGIISTGHQITEDIQCCPHTATLADALENLPQATFVLSLLEDNRLAIRAEAFEAIVHCLNSTDLPTVGPDPASYLCDNRLATAMEIAGLLATDGAQKVINATIQLRNGSVVASNGNVILEAWHGVAMPALLIAPKAIATAASRAMGKQGKGLARFGYSPASLTLHCEDGAWLKTQLYPADTELPDLLRWLEVSATPVEIPEGFFELVKRLEPFSEDGQILFSHGEVRVTKQSLSTYALETAKWLRGISMSFSIKSLLTIQPYVKKVHFNAANGVTIFYGDTVRAAVATGKGV
jgi:hypothetical protein